MARKPRVHYPGALYHVILRGSDGQSIFFDDKDRTCFSFLLQEGVERFGHRIHAFCLMSNHVHLAIQVEEVSLSRILQNLSFRYTRWVNWRQGRSGHLFQGRYKAVLVDADVYLLELTRYIHLNPVRAGMVEEPQDYLKTMVNRATRHGKLKYNHLDKVKKIPENNVRMKILTPDEFSRVLDACPLDIRPVVMVAYSMGMRRAEITKLTWPEVDLQKGFIRLSADRTKTDSARAIPIHPIVRAMLEELPRGLHTDRVFLKEGKPFDEFKRSFSTACRKVGIQDFVFHDLRHCALNNLRKSGNDFFEIMALSGHKTMSCFKRYNLVTEEELAKIKWPTQGNVGEEKSHANQANQGL